jgi:hypothetical protein
MTSLIRFLAATFAALLPRDFRTRWAWGFEWNLVRPAIVSGLAEAVVSLTVVILRYFAFFQWRMATIADAAIKRGAGDEALGTGAAQFGAGYTVMIEYALHPLTLLLIYFTIEGAFRLLAAALADECVGTLPLYLMAWAVGRARRGWKESQLPPRVPDEVQICQGISYDLCIASCRPKRDWDKLITVEYNDQLYVLFDEKRGTSARPYLYRLRKITPEKVIRGLHHYHPEEVLTKKQRLEFARNSVAQESK